MSEYMLFIFYKHYCILMCLCMSLLKYYNSMIYNIGLNDGDVLILMLHALVFLSMYIFLFTVFLFNNE